MYIVSFKCVVGEVGSYCQLAVSFLFFVFLVSPYQTRANVVPQFIFDPPFYKSGSTPETFPVIFDAFGVTKTNAHLKALLGKYVYHLLLR